MQYYNLALKTRNDVWKIIALNTTKNEIYTDKIYLFKVNNRKTRKGHEICSNITTKKKQSDVNDVTLVFLLLTSNIFYTFSSSFIVDFE